MTIDVSAIVMTKNESKNIAKCLASLHGIGEIFVVDSGSTDGTQIVARELGAKVVTFQWNGRYPKKKQWCLENLPFANNWVFFVDADEEATPDLLSEIRRATSSKVDVSGYFVGYDYVFLGRTLRHGQRVYKLVLFDRRKGRFDPVDDLAAENMWEVEGHYQPRVLGNTATLKNAMIHRDHDSLFHYFDRHNRYSDWEAVVRLNAIESFPKESQMWRRAAMKRLFDAVPFKGLAAFVFSYVVQRGFLDGRAGLHYAIAKGFYYWQTELKLAELKAAKPRAGDRDDGTELQR